MARYPEGHRRCIWAATGTSPPEITAFSADPMVLEDGASAIYYFEVKNATDVQLVEADEVIREITNPPFTSCRGKARGRATYQIRTGSSNTFDALLVAWNSGGKQQRRLTLSFATKVKPWTGSLIPPVSYEGMDNTKKPEWKDQTTSLSPEEPAAGQVVSTYPPPFEKCPKDCNYCLQPDEAVERGFTQQCSKQPCYYSPDKQQYWYCYSKPVTAWCCVDGKVVEVTPEICSQKGGDAYATEDEALKACQRDGWCCRDGKVGPLTQSRCREMGGQWFASEKEAVEACATDIWCCLDGDVFQTTSEICRRKGGSVYTTEADAIKACQRDGWCCRDGKVGPLTQSRCRDVGGAWFATEKEAVEACATDIWCCRDGKVMKTTRELCAEMGGAAFDTRAEAERYCQQAMSCWCCANGKVFQSTQSQCAQYGGNCYSTQAEANRACYQTPTVK